MCPDSFVRVRYGNHGEEKVRRLLYLNASEVRVRRREGGAAAAVSECECGASAKASRRLACARTCGRVPCGDGGLIIVCPSRHSACDLSAALVMFSTAHPQ